MKISYLSLLAISLLTGVSVNSLNAINEGKCEEEKLTISTKKETIDSGSATSDDNQPPKSPFSKFQKMDVTTFFESIFPKLTPQEKIKAIKIYEELIKGGSSPIDEGNPKGLPDKNKTLAEGGYAFPPMIAIQGPFIEHYASGNQIKRILDIGAGSGSDTIPLLLTKNVQVIAVDIYPEQIAELTTKVSGKLKIDFPDLIEKTRFATLKRNFAEKGSVPTAYINQIDAVNMTRVAHFFNGEEFSTMLENLATMLKDNGMLSLTVSTTREGQKEHKWIESQKKEGLSDPELIYYDTFKKIRKNPMQASFDSMLPGTVELVQRKEVGLKSPGTKKEWVVDRGVYWENTIRQGRFYHSLESLKMYMAGKFEILDSVTIDWDSSDIFLSILARRLPRK